ncbi:hypothetical protein C7444_101118 [Sphaerotilus hippei]|uniref:Uncharacterized protein n=1 Tax=Sphaerotilus hippei TaxID=744406 RepID=A0A318HDJ0_9BURK|nr:hypothetical protein [Sphaerotilus hippei]PXW99289.1 hypothetical protein C7444_101118 [Sphaerotilus hippei]
MASTPSTARGGARKGRLPSGVAAQVTPPPVPRLEQLRRALLPTMDCLRRCRADLIDMALIDDYVDLNWLEWQGGSLKLTVTGRNICAQLQRAQREASSG